MYWLSIVRALREGLFDDVLKGFEHKVCLGPRLLSFDISIQVR